MTQSDILLIEDNPDDIELTRIAFTEAGIEQRLVVVRDGAEALDYLFARGAYAGRNAREQPAIVLLDLNLPDTVGTSGVEAIRQRFPRVPVMVLSAAHDRATIDRCLRAGASGFLAKTASGERLGTAVRAVAGGGIYVPRDAEGTPARASWAAAHAGAPGGPRAEARDLGLTDRQSDVLRLILRGLPNKLIGRQLQLAEGTVKVHVSAVLRALGVRNRTQAVLAANRLGLKLPD